MRARSCRGFTLVETLVAIAILGVVLSSVLSLFATGLQGARRDEERLRLAWFAETLLVRSGLDLVPGEGALDGRTASGIAWRVERLPYELPALPEAEESLLPPETGQDEGEAAATAQGEAEQQRQVRLWQIRVMVEQAGESLLLETIRAEAVDAES